MHEQLLTCPDCNFNPLNITVEDGKMMFFCENCGWQRTERNYFYLTKWSVKIHQALAPIDILESLLTEILDTVSREELIMGLAERATSVAVGPKFDKVVGGIIRECKLELDRPFVEDLRELNELRNKIIHEGKIETIHIQQVHNSFGL